MRCLLDTNVFLELILGQAAADAAHKLLSLSNRHAFFTTDFSFHSIGILLFRRGMHDYFARFAIDMLINAGVSTLSLLPRDIESVVKVSKQFKLDFDDAYQYVAAEKHDLMLVSFDADFDRTVRGKRTPVEVLASLRG